MPRKRTRKHESDDSDCDSELETIVVDRSQRYGLRPRKAQLFSEEDLVDDDENEFLSDFEDELQGRNVKAVCYTSGNVEDTAEEATTEVDSVDYDELITPGVVVNENHIDYEKVIEKTEIQVLRRSKPESPPPGEQSGKKRRGRKPRWLIEKEKADAEAQENGFCHFLDTGGNIAEDLPSLALGHMLSTSLAEHENTEVSENPQVTENPQDAEHLEVPENSEVPQNPEVPENTLIDTTNGEEVSGNAIESVPDIFPTNGEEFSENAMESVADSILSANGENIPEIVEGSNNVEPEQEEIQEMFPIPDVTINENVDYREEWQWLIQSMDDQTWFVDCDDSVALVKEKMPKARFHYLVVPRKNIIGLADLTDENIPLVNHMYEYAKKVNSYPDHENVTFKIGFCAQPTTLPYNQKKLRLQLHVVSDDMESENLMLKKHWNEIHSKLFLTPEGMLFVLITYLTTDERYFTNFYLVTNFSNTVIKLSAKL